MIKVNDYRVVSKERLNDKKHEERVYPRVDQNLDAVYRIFQSDPDAVVVQARDIEYSTTTRNIGAGGVVVDSDKPLPVGSVIEVRIYLDTQRKESVECLAKVCRVEKEREGDRYHIVAYFLDISSADRNKIVLFVNEKLKLLQENKKS